MRFQTKIPNSPKIGEKWGTLAFLVILTLFCGMALGQEKPILVSYDLNVTIEPSQGTITVHGNIGVPVVAGAKTLQFGLHETFVITKLLVNGQSAKFSFRPGDPSPIFPATHKVVVKLPRGVPAGRAQ